MFIEEKPIVTKSHNDDEYVSLSCDKKWLKHDFLNMMRQINLFAYGTIYIGLVSGWRTTTHYTHIHYNASILYGIGFGC